MVFRRTRLRAQLGLPNRDCGARDPSSVCCCLTAASDDLADEAPESKPAVVKAARKLHIRRKPKRKPKPNPPAVQPEPAPPRPEPEPLLALPAGPPLRPPQRKRCFPVTTKPFVARRGSPLDSPRSARLVAAMSLMGRLAHFSEDRYLIVDHSAATPVSLYRSPALRVRRLPQARPRVLKGDKRRLTGGTS